jgi:hypothetical protein
MLHGRPFSGALRIPRISTLQNLVGMPTGILELGIRRDDPVGEECPQ